MRQEVYIKVAEAIQRRRDAYAEGFAKAAGLKVNIPAFGRKILQSGGVSTKNGPIATPIGPGANKAIAGLASSMNGQLTPGAFLSPDRFAAYVRSSHAAKNPDAARNYANQMILRSNRF